MLRLRLGAFAAVLMLEGVARAGTATPPPAPISPQLYQRLAGNPARLQALMHPAPVQVPDGLLRGVAVAPAGSPWTSVAHTALPNPGAMLQLTDGRLLIQDQGSANNGTGNWWTLTPDSKGNYADGIWTQVATMPAGYAPLYYASQVLPDGRVIVMGGEYNFGSLVWTNLGAIYDPVANQWTPVATPDGGTGEWVRIGDGPSTLLANGTFMFGASGYSGTTVEALLNPATLSWTDTGAGKADGNGEEGWSLLPSGQVLTVDTDNLAAPQNTEIYTPATGSWASAGNTPLPLPDSDGEIGPSVTLHSGSVFAVGASGNNAVYSPGTGRWAAAPAFPVLGGRVFDEADGPAAVLPNGQVLMMASPGEYQTPSHFFIYNGSTISRTADTSDAAGLSSFDGFMLDLPTGQILFNDRVGGLWLYTATGAAPVSAEPKIISVATALRAGRSYTVKGTQLSGLTQGAAYGDDFQDGTNLPLVAIVNTATGDLVFARTSGITSTSVAPHAKGSATFAVPAGIETGAAELYVIASGVRSTGVAVTVSP